MTLPLNLLQSASKDGYRTNQSGDIVVVTMPGAAFVTTTKEHMQAQQWARASASLGNTQRDRTAYCARHQTLLARNGCGLATRGPGETLSNVVKAMQEHGLKLSEWSVPQNLKPKDETGPSGNLAPAAAVIK